MSSKEERNDRVPSVCSDVVPVIPRSMYAEIVGTELTYHRRLRKLTQTEVAAKINVSPSTVSSIERGRMLPGIPMLFHLCAAIGISPTTVISVVDETLNQ